MNYESIRKYKEIFSNDYYKNILFKSIVDSFIECKELILAANKIDVYKSGDEVDIDKLVDLVHHYGTKNDLYHLEVEEVFIDNNRGKKLYCPKGICGVVIEDNECYAFFEIIIANIICHNISIVNMESKRNYGTIKMITDIVNSCVENLLGIKEVICLSNETYNQFCNYYEEYDFMVFIGNNKFIKSKKSDCLIPNICIPYKEYKMLYSDYDTLTKYAQALDGIKNMPLQMYSDIKEIVKQLNEEHYFSISLLTDKTDDMNYFINYCNCSFLFINNSPLIQHNLDIDLSNLLSLKSIFR